MKLTSTRADLVKLPLRVDSAFLAKHQRAGEPTVLAKVAGLGNIAPYEYRGHGARSYVLRWELKMNAHVLRVPARLWMQDDHRMAHDLLDHDMLPQPVVILLELPDPPARKPRKAPAKPTAAAKP